MTTMTPAEAGKVLGIPTVEEVLVALRAAKDELERAQFDFECKIKDAFPQERVRIAQEGMAVTHYEERLKEAIGAYGPLPAEAKSEAGWAHYSSAVKRTYAPVPEWRKALMAAGLGYLITSVITEAVNGKVVDNLFFMSFAFHEAVKALVTEKEGKLVLRYGFAPEKPTGLVAELGAKG